MTIKVFQVDTWAGSNCHQTKSCQSVALCTVFSAILRNWRSFSRLNLQVGSQIVTHTRACWTWQIVKEKKLILICSRQFLNPNFLNQLAFWFFHWSVSIRSEKSLVKIILTFYYLIKLFYLCDLYNFGNYWSSASNFLA